MAVIRANAEYVNQGIPKHATGIYYVPRSDFINLSKLGKLVLIKKLGENKGEESQGTLTLQGWIWENVVKVLESLALDKSMSIECEPGPKGELEMRIQREKYIMGLTAENTIVTNTMHDSFKSLSEEEWEWVTMTPEEFKWSNILRWHPIEDPRPEWRIKKTQGKISRGNIQKDTSGEKIHSRKNSVPETCENGLRSERESKVPNPAIVGCFGVVMDNKHPLRNQYDGVTAIKTEHNDYKCDKKYRLS